MAKIKSNAKMTENKKKKIVLAFSGGLDTSFCLLYLQEKYNADVVTVTVDTGGFSEQKLKEIEKKAKTLGAAKHYTIDGKKEVFDKIATYIIKANVLKGTYPLSVGTERVVQAEEIAKIAKKEKAKAIVHGSTGAGNDQVRFDVAFSLLLPEMSIIAPIRELNISREEEIKFLKEHGVKVPEITKTYSINEGLWGTTIGGGETKDTWKVLKENAYIKTVSPENAVDKPEFITIGFSKGIPTELNGKKLDGVSLVLSLNKIAAKHGVGRGMHIGDTIFGIKGRIGFEAPAPMILIKAHQELEKLVLTKWQQFIKNSISSFYSNFLHDGLYFDPVMRDMEAMIDSSQKHVVGIVKLKLYKGNADVIGCKSKFSMMDHGIAIYGEKNVMWTGLDAKGFCKIQGLQSLLAKRASQKGQKGGGK